MKILIAMDSSQLSEKILLQVCKGTWPQDAEFRLISVVESTASWETRQQLNHQAQVILDKRVADLKAKFSDHRVEGSVLEGMLPEAIIEEALHNKTDLLIIGSHGDTGCRRVDLGSIAAAIVNAAPCTIQVVKVCSQQAEATDKKMQASQR